MSSDAVNAKILSSDVDVIYQDSGEPEVLNNLRFLISQVSPLRRVEVNIGPDDWTTYVIESDHGTWGYGRYHELTEKLLSDRNIYSRAHAPGPQILKEGTDDKWRPAAWEFKSRPIDNVIILSQAILWIAIVVEAVLALGAVLSYYDPQEKTAAEDRGDKTSALYFYHWAGHHAWIIAFINISYVLLIIFISRLARALRKSKVIFKGSAAWESLSFRKNDDTVQLAGLYLAFLALLVSILALALLSA